jgi:hypothetical protein
MAIQKTRQKVRVKVINKKTKAVISDAVETNSYGNALVWLKIPSVRGVTEKFVVEVTHVEDHQFKTPYAQRLATQQRNQAQAEAWAKEREAKAVVRSRARIMNQIELAFVKNGRDAVQFVTCDTCDALATLLKIPHLTPGAVVIDPEQILGAACEFHNPYKGSTTIECNRLEFFYEGIRQIAIKAAATA